MHYSHLAAEEVEAWRLGQVIRWLLLCLYKVMNAYAGNILWSLPLSLCDFALNCSGESCHIHPHGDLHLLLVLSFCIVVPLSSFSLSLSFLPLKSFEPGRRKNLAGGLACQSSSLCSENESRKKQGISEGRPQSNIAHLSVWWAVSTVCTGSALCRRPAFQFTLKNKFSTSERASYWVKSECRLLMAFWSVCLNPVGADSPRDVAK